LRQEAFCADRHFSNDSKDPFESIVAHFYSCKKFFSGREEDNPLFSADGAHILARDMVLFGFGEEFKNGLGA
jgi:hypothetical protein